MKINWKVRIKNKMFWLALIPALLLLAQAALRLLRPARARLSQADCPRSEFSIKQRQHIKSCV